MAVFTNGEKGLRSIGEIIKAPKFSKGDKVYYVGKSQAYHYDKPYEVIDCKPKSETIYGLELRLSPNQITYCSPDDFISEAEYKKLTSEDPLDVSSGHDFKDGDRVYYNGPRHELIEQGRMYVLFKYSQNIIGKKFFEICAFDRVKNEERWLTLEKEFVDNNFISEKEYKEKTKSFSSILSKNKFKEGSVAYYDGPGDMGYEYNVPYRIQKNRSDDKLWDIWVKEKKAKFGGFKFPTKEFVENNFLTEDEYKIVGKVKNVPTRSNVVSNYREFSRFKDGDTVFYVGETNKKKIGFQVPDRVGGLQSNQDPPKNDKPYIIDFYNRSAGMIRVKGVSYSYPEKDFATAEEYERLKSLDEEVPTPSNEVGIRKNDIMLKFQIFKDTKKNVLKWIRPYSTHEDWYRAYVYLDQPPNSHLRLDLKRPSILGEREDKWQLEIYYHRNRNPISQIGGEAPIHITGMQESSVIVKLAKLVSSLVDEEELKSSNDEEDRITWD
jgi:hypothetical protein